MNNGNCQARVDHVVDFHRCYPGEKVTFFTRAEIMEPRENLTLRISLPEELELEELWAVSKPDGQTDIDQTSSVEVDGAKRILVWSLAGELTPRKCYEYRTEATVAPTSRDVQIESRAVLTGTAEDSAQQVVLAEESTTIAVQSKGQYLRYLPEIYEQDDLMSRLLMLFESFWAPIEMQIDNMHCYFDPRLTSSRLLPWLATWVGLDPDERLPEERQRELLRSAVSLYRRRGTGHGLKDYLEIYTGGEAKIIEYRAENFRLGPEAKLGPNIALGRENEPHTFTVMLSMPPLSDSDHGNRRHPDKTARQAEKRRRMIERIIETQKPAHTGYKLVISET